MGTVRFTDVHTGKPVWVHTNELDKYHDEIHSPLERDREALIEKLQDDNEALRMLIKVRKNFEFNAQREIDEYSNGQNQIQQNSVPERGTLHDASEISGTSQSNSEMA